jgi:phosphonoacetaldehyde dehydrogenase
VSTAWLGAGPRYRPPCILVGAPCDAGGRIAVTDPATGTIVGEVPDLPAALLADRLAAQRHRRPVALPRWRRAEILERVADLLTADRERLARLISLESGLSLADTRHEVWRAQDVFRLAASEARRDDGVVYAGDPTPRGRARRAITSREPVRLVAAFTPFNHPLNQVAHKIAPAVAVGAPIIVKPSEKTPLAALWLAEALLEAGLPGPDLSVVTGSAAEILEVLLAEPAVEVISFTGSVRVGRLIAARLGFRRAVLELGGNDPLVVLADADLELAAELAVTGATANSGQRCTAVKRIIAEAPIADALVDRMAARMGALVCGDPLDEATDVGTVIDAEAAATIRARISAAVDGGARLVVGDPGAGAFVPPALLDDVRPDQEVVRLETFGPVAPVIRVADLDAALEVANGTAFGLSAGVVTGDLTHAIRCARELRCGTVNINEVPGFRTEVAPFGGIGESGLGVKEGVVDAMRAMTYQKLVGLPWP